MLRKCRDQYDYLLRKQNDQSGEFHETQLKFKSVRELLEQTTGAAEMQNVLLKLDTNYDAKISFEEFQTAMVASQAEQDDAVLKSSFRRLDLNGDHFVTYDEIHSSMTANEDALRRIGKT